MNQLPFEKRREMKRLLALGVSFRTIANVLNCCKNTVWRYSKVWKFSPVCPCGRPAGHKAWCRTRLEYSPQRRGWLADHWGKRSGGHIAANVDRAYVEAAKLGHKLGPFVWAAANTPALAYAICGTCEKRVRLNSGDGFRDALDGTALREICLSAEERAAKEAAKKEKKQWREAKRTLVEIKRHLRPSHSRTPASPRERTSHA